MNSLTIDFTKSQWGHALHDMTWREHKQTWWSRLVDAFLGYPKRDIYSVMVHSTETPRQGMLIKYRVKGGTVYARILKVRPCGDPRDMYTLVIERDNTLRKLDRED